MPDNVILEESLPHREIHLGTPTSRLRLQVATRTTGDRHLRGSELGRMFYHKESTSGGAILWGQHCLKTWSRTQSLVAKSSAEAELYTAVRASCEGLGAQTLLQDLGEQVQARVFIDASAAKSIIEREGLAKVRHIDVNVSWIQEQGVCRKLPLHKILGTSNPADLMTKHLNQDQIVKYLHKLDIHYKQGRSDKVQSYTHSTSK